VPALHRAIIQNQEAVRQACDEFQHYTEMRPPRWVQYRPRTAEGKQRLLQAHLLHGEHTKTARAEYSKDSAKLSILEDCLRVLGMDIKRRQGRKASGYRAVRTIEDVTEFVKGLR